MIRFLCKKDYDFDGKCMIHIGNVAYVDFDSDTANIPFFKSTTGEKICIDAKLERDEFFRHFKRYDNSETINVRDMMCYYIFKHGLHFKEKQMLFRMQAYIIKRLKFMKSCATEDTQ